MKYTLDTVDGFLNFKQKPSIGDIYTNDFVGNVKLTADEWKRVRESAKRYLFALCVATTGGVVAKPVARPSPSRPSRLAGAPSGVVSDSAAAPSRREIANSNGLVD